MTSSKFMTTICAGGDLDRFLQSLETEPSLYSQVVICSPFVDRRLCKRLTHFAETARKVGCGVRLITKGGEVPALLPMWPGRNQRGVKTLVAIPRLHAKVYLAVGRDRQNSWAVVTSANLTEAGLRKNIELGLLVRAASSDGARIVEQVRRFLESLSSVTKER